MAKHKIFIGNYGIDRVRVGDSKSTDYSYSLEEKILKVFWRGKLIDEREAEPGDAFIVKCDGGEPKVSEMFFPKHPNDFLMYILGFGNGLRCHDWDRYISVLESERKAKRAKDRTEYKFSSENYEFRFYEDSKGRPYHLAAFIGCDLSKEEYIEILEEWPYPIRYSFDFLRPAFRERFGLSKHETDHIFKVWSKK